MVLGHVAPTPWATAAGDALVGKAINDDTAAKAADVAVQGAQPLSRNGHKIQLARVAVRRAILRAAGRNV